MKHSFPANHFNIRRDPASYREVNRRERLFLTFVLISFFSVSCIQAKEPQDNIGNMAPDFKLQDLNQNTFTLSSYKDKQPVILFFWTTWCPFCQTELKVLNNKYYSLLKDGVQLLAIDAGEVARRVDNFVKNQGIVFSVLLDSDTTVADAYNILGVPTYILIDKKGQIRFRGNSFPQEYKKLILQ